VAARIASIESFRVLAIFTVILWHTGFAADLSRLADESLPVVLTGYLIWWIGVPYFFITAGYFFRQSVLTHGNPIAQLRRFISPLVWIFLGWMCLYIVIPRSWPGEILHHGLWQPFYSTAQKNIQLLATDNIGLFLQGHSPVFHLWFLPALMFSLAVLTLITICRLQCYLIHLSIGLYVLAITEEISGGLFSTSALRVGTWSIALLLTATGWVVAERKQPSATVAWSLIIGGYVLALLEGTLLNAIFHISLQHLKWHYFLGGIILGVGIFLLALAKPTLGQSTPFPFLARYTLGVYVSHILVVYTLDPLSWRLKENVPLSGAIIAVLVYGFSVLLTIALTRLPLTKYLVIKPSWRYHPKSWPENPLTDPQRVSREPDISPRFIMPFYIALDLIRSKFLRRNRPDVG
jgi:surface polysaccharide O-acyltransferase-like enzyme